MARKSHVQVLCESIYDVRDLVVAVLEGNATPEELYEQVGKAVDVADDMAATYCLTFEDDDSDDDGPGPLVFIAGDVHA